MANSFPAEIIIDIFSRLPVESVVECRLVCKTWLTLTYNLYFAHLHLHRRRLLQPDDEDHLKKYPNLSNVVFVAPSKVGFLSLNRLHKSTFEICYLEYYDENDEKRPYMTLRRINHPLTSKLSYPLRSVHPLDKPRFLNYMVGSCNGLICFSLGISHAVYICNLITREYVFLPKINEEGITGCPASGFGYHPKTNEYKVVRIFYLSDQPSVGRVQVYTLGGGSGWRNKREINSSLLSNNTLSPSNYANGHLYWWDNSDLYGKVMTFDLGDEVFRAIPLPPPFCFLLNLRVFKYLQIQVLGGCLCYIDYSKCDSVDIWSFKKNRSSCMEDEDFQSWSWNMECTIQLNDLNIHKCDIFDLTKSGEVLFWYRRRVVRRYDPKTATLEDVVGLASGLEVFETIPYFNSFVSLKALGEEDVKMINRIN